MFKALESVFRSRLQWGAVVALLLAGWAAPASAQRERRHCSVMAAGQLRGCMEFHDRSGGMYCVNWGFVNLTDSTLQVRATKVYELEGGGQHTSPLDFVVEPRATMDSRCVGFSDDSTLNDYIETARPVSARLSNLRVVNRTEMERQREEMRAREEAEREEERQRQEQAREQQRQERERQEQREREQREQEAERARQREEAEQGREREATPRETDGRERAGQRHEQQERLAAAQRDREEQEQREREREEAAYQERQAGRQQTADEWAGTVGTAMAQGLLIKVPPELAHYWGPSWRLSLFGGAAFVTWPLYVDETTTISDTRTRSSELVGATSVAMRAGVEIWPVYSPSAGIAAFAEGGVGVSLAALSIWGGAGARTRLGTRAVALLGEVGLVHRYASYGTELRAEGASVIDVGSAGYTVLRYGVGLGTCVGADTLAGGCKLSVDLWLLVDVPRQTPSDEPAPLVLRASFGWINGLDASIEVGPVNRSYSASGTPGYVLEESGTGGLYLVGGLSLRWDLFGEPY